MLFGGMVKNSIGVLTRSLGELKLLQRYLNKGSRLLIYDGVVSDNVLKLLMDFGKAGWHVIVDVESEHDLQVLSKYADIHVGIRVKPFYKPGGKWSHSAGWRENSV